MAYRCRYLEWLEAQYKYMRDSAIAIIALIILAVGCILSSCKTCIPVIEYKDSIRIEYKHDSIYEYKHDSIFQDRWRSGDTVYVNVEKYSVLYKDKIVEVHDTIKDIKHDVQQVEVVKPFYRGCTIAFWFLVVVLIVGLVVYLFVKFYK